MKIPFVFFCLFSLSIMACKDTEEAIVFESSGELIGLDMTLTPCSGGCIIIIDEQRVSYRIEDFPIDFEIDYQTAVFPLDVQLNWTINRNCSNNVFIDINNIEYVD